MASMTPTTGAFGRQTIMTKPVPEVDQVHPRLISLSLPT